MSVVRCLVGGLIGGATGIAIWVLVGYFTHYEVGWIAWVVGFLTGVGIRYAAYLHNEEASFGKAILASLMAIGAILTAKFLVFALLVGGRGDEILRQAANQMRFDDDAMIASIADDIADEAVKRGETIAWPPGTSRNGIQARRLPHESLAEGPGPLESIGTQRTAGSKATAHNACHGLVRARHTTKFWRVLYALGSSLVRTGDFHRVQGRQRDLWK